jgi:asparagine synthase (glutamine-hydrolysing)
MCGFTISINKVSNPNLYSQFQSSLNNISHRGPDASNIVDLGKVTLGHVRLSIIDLSARSNQPLASNDNSLFIVFNGEIYNYKKLKAELNNWDYKTESDTEVILAAYSKWGINCFERFVGQFSIAIYDKKKNRLVISRDRMGEKPLYFHLNDQGLFFSSEIKGLLPFLNQAPTIDESAFNDYLHYQYVPEPGCIISGIYKVEAGTVTLYDIPTLKKTVIKFWSWQHPEFFDKKIEITDIEKELIKSIEYSLVSDVPIAIGLSAGLDSAAIAYYAKNAGCDLASFTVGYSQRPAYDERDGAASFAKYIGIKNYQVEISPNDFMINFSSFCDGMTEPIADIAGYGHYMVPKIIAEHGYKVMLSGIGGDELFWGYEWTRLAVLYNQIIKHNPHNVILQLFKNQKKLLNLIFVLSKTRKVPKVLRPYFRLLHSFLVHDTPKNQGMFMGISGAQEFTSSIHVGEGYYGRAMLNKKLEDPFRYTKDLKGSSNFHETNLLNVLSKLNRTWLMSNSIQLLDSLSMASSIEARSPLINKDLIKMVLTYNVQNGVDSNGKSILKKILSDKIPAEFINKPKSGFVVPVGLWVKQLEENFKDHINEGHLIRSGMLEKNFFSFTRNKNITIHTKYRIILLELWFSSLLNLFYSGNKKHN